jgi:hypothetical protein
MNKVSGVARDLETDVPCYQVEDEEGRIHLLLHHPIEEKDEGPLVSLASRSGRI